MQNFRAPDVGNTPKKVVKVNALAHAACAGEPEGDIVVVADPVGVCVVVIEHVCDDVSERVFDGDCVLVSDPVALHDAASMVDPGGHEPGQVHGVGALEPMGQNEPETHSTLVERIEPAGQ